MSLMVEARRVRKRFGHNEVLKGISLEVPIGGVVVIIGPSGSGKSTFLRCINHLEQIDGGRLFVDGGLVGYEQKGDKLYELKDKVICQQRVKIGMVFQSFNLFPHMTACRTSPRPQCGRLGSARRRPCKEATTFWSGLALAIAAAAIRASSPGGSSRG